jgi:hypothetical protein
MIVLPLFLVIVADEVSINRVISGLFLCDLSPEFGHKHRQSNGRPIHSGTRFSLLQVYRAAVPGRPIDRYRRGNIVPFGLPSFSYQYLAI